MVTGKSPIPKKQTPNTPRRSNVSDTPKNELQNISSTQPSEAPQPTPTSPAAVSSTEQTTEPKNHDDTDVEALLSRHTFDGKGDAAVPPSDFKGFASSGVEKPAKSVEDLAQEVLHGNWGADAQTIARRLHEAGHDVLAVEKEFNRRRASGAPSAL